MINLNSFRPAIGVYIQESFFQQVEKRIHLSLMIFASLVVLSQLYDQVTADLDDGIPQVVGLSQRKFQPAMAVGSDETYFALQQLDDQGHLLHHQAR